VKLHPRTFIVNAARIAIHSAVCDAITKNPDLTHAELTGILAELIAQWNRYAIKDEREETA
jgi:hypothetical protein